MAEEERTLGQLVAQASEDLSALVRYEVALAKAEVKDDVRRGAIGGVLILVVAVLFIIALITLVIAAGYGLVAAGLAGVPDRHRGSAAARGGPGAARRPAAEADQTAGEGDPLHEADAGRRPWPEGRLSRSPGGPA